MFRYPYNKIFQGLNIIKNAGGGWQLKGKKRRWGSGKYMAQFLELSR